MPILAKELALYREASIPSLKIPPLAGGKQSLAYLASLEILDTNVI